MSQNPDTMDFGLSAFGSPLGMFAKMSYCSKQTPRMVDGHEFVLLLRQCSIIPWMGQHGPPCRQGELSSLAQIPVCPNGRNPNNSPPLHILRAASQEAPLPISNLSETISGISGNFWKKFGTLRTFSVTSSAHSL